jgi:hypothetical protein
LIKRENWPNFKDDRVPNQRTFFRLLKGQTFQYTHLLVLYLASMRPNMDGLIPFVLKALKKKKTMKHYRSLSSSSGRPAQANNDAELAPKGCLFMTPQHPRAPRWHDGEGSLFMTPEHPRSSSRWLDDGDVRGEPAAAATPVTVVPLPLRKPAKGHNPQRLVAMEAPPLRH